MEKQTNPTGDQHSVMEAQRDLQSRAPTGLTARWIMRRISVASRAIRIHRIKPVTHRNEDVGQWCVAVGDVLQG